ncbi:DUF6415 family natural product biosynthesis protein [Streptomyces luteogriseus]|uniref:DUF6415 family natural product biosynthesis protein n=1 Tax=Streptomyces luteogriseus TaxID=68233 RepID=UPI0036E5C4B4
MSAKLQTLNAAALPPPDLEKMRESAGMVLGPDSAPEAVPPAGDELDTLTAALRGHLELLGPEVEQAARQLPKDSPTRAGALACVGEARGKLRAPELGFVVLVGGVIYTRRLARVLAALCDHYEIVSAGIEETPEQTAFRHLSEHQLRCRTCKAVGDDGMNLGLPCAEEDRLEDEYRRARSRAARERLGRRGHSTEVTA